jgi:hypothetical protein
MLILARQRRCLACASAHSKLAATLDVEKMKADAAEDSENNGKDAKGTDAKSRVTPIDLSGRKRRLSIPRILLFSLSVVSLLIGAGGATAHYVRWSWGNRAHPVGWLLSMLFLLLAFMPSPSEIATGLKSLIKPRTVFFLFWILFFVVSHLWNFRTAPWNGLFSTITFGVFCGFLVITSCLTRHLFLFFGAPSLFLRFYSLSYFLARPWSPQSWHSPSTFFPLRSFTPLSDTVIR